jgi:elongation factor P
LQGKRKNRRRTKAEKRLQKPAVRTTKPAHWLYRKGQIARKGMIMYTAADLRKGLRIEIDGAPYIVTEFNFAKPGKGAAIYNCKMKNMITGSTLNRSYRSNDKFEEPRLEERTMRFSYMDGDQYTFIDKTFEQVNVPATVLGDARFFLEEDTEVEILIHNGEPIGVELPTFVEKEIIETEPGFRGNTATNVTKPAKITGGYEIQVPLFVNQGDVVKIDTRTGQYSDRSRLAKT